MRGIVRLALPLTLPLALPLLAPPALAQEVQVRATSQTTKVPLPGALISLRDLKGQVILRVLADERGRATLKALAAGSYRVRVDAIGYAGLLSDTMDLVPDAPRLIEIALAAAPMALKELVVTSSRAAVCDLDQAEGTAVARIWEEARKALTATALTRANRSLEFEVRLFDRELDARGRLVDETASSKRGPSERPFQAADPEFLHRWGYVEVQEGDSIRYSAPDADLLLSDRFLDDHCFELADPDKANPGRVGLAFAPIPSRQVSDVKGTLWLDERTMELSHLEFRYTNVDLPEESRDVGGRIEFSKLPNGGWIVSRWHIRMPMVHPITFAPAKSRLRGYREAAGEAALAGQPAAPSGVTSVVGTVYDSVAGAPLGGVVVSIQAGAFADTSDASGRFQIVSPGVGDYLVTFEHPRFRLFRLDSVLASAKLARGTTDTVSAAIPSVSTLLSRLCPNGVATDTTAALVGLVRDAATGTPIAATVTIRSTSLTVQTRATGAQRGGAPGPRVTVSERGTSWEFDTEPGGRFQVCGIPQAPDLTLIVAAKGHRPLQRSLSTESKRLVDLEIAVP